MPQLEVLRIGFHFPVAQDIEAQRSIIPNATRVTLSNLHWLGLSGLSMSLQVFLSWLITPRLKKLSIFFFNQLIFSDSTLLQFLNTTERLRFGSARLAFREEAIEVRLYPNEEARMYALQMQIGCNSLHWQVRCVRQLINELGTVFSTVEYLTLLYISLGCHQEAGRTHWRKLLQAFNNVRTLSVPEGLVRELSSSLRPDYGESPIEPVLLPELKTLSYSAIGDANGAFTAFVNGHQNVGRPITLANQTTTPFRENDTQSQPSPWDGTSPDPRSIGDISMDTMSFISQYYFSPFWVFNHNVDYAL